MDPQSPMCIALGVIAGLAVGMLPACAVLWWFGHRAHRQIVQAAAARHRRWQAKQAERRRQWALQQQVREMEQQIREEAMSEEERHWHRQWRQRQAEITREARRRLGLPEEDHDG
jgi:hypothetical protein